MKISINTTSSKGHLILFILNSNGIEIIRLRENQNDSIMLTPGQTYRFEWHVWCPEASDYEINAEVIPASNNFLPFHLKRSYPSSHQDFGGFYFTI